ncbi:MAG TPA: DUF4446 family protein [Candidatus Eisenbergiella merdigallinarum]|uniref:DUF4446 family protein n=1 Tax=Candidatus Eisenbergiella merdigallinarum TaxID=2838552 RepID=A0A9D2MTA3_9FIRM|nr:DUF4446 family protein [Candidatus Eisenbergiella merdigallinarum]
MSSPLMEYLGIAGMDVAYLFIAIFVLLIAIIVLLIVQMVKYSKLKKKYEKFMKGKDAKSLEQDIIALFEDNKFIKNENEKNRKDIREILRRMEYCYQKIGLVKYDAFQQMGGKLSFCLCLLDNKNSGFILNSVHSSDGCYSYTKEIKKGESEISLGEEEKKALDMAMGY